MGPILAVEMWAGSSEKNWGKKNKSSVKKKIEMVKPTNVVSLNKVGTHLDQRFPTRVSRTPRGTWEISRGTPVWGFHWKCPKNAFSQLTRGYASFSFLCLGVREQKKVGNRWSRSVVPNSKYENLSGIAFKMGPWQRKVQVFLRGPWVSGLYSVLSLLHVLGAFDWIFYTQNYPELISNLQNLEKFKNNIFRTMW